MPKLTLKIIDHSREYSEVAFRVPTLSAGNFDATSAAMDAVQAAVLALTAGNISRRRVESENVHVNDDTPSNEYAQVELGLRLFYRDTVNGEKFHLTIPAPDLALIAEEGTDDVDMSLSVVDTLTTTIEALTESKYGNPVEFYKGTIVGRKS